MLKVLPHGGLGGGVPARGVVGMDPDRAVQEVETVDQGKHLLLVGNLLTGIGHHHRPAHPGVQEAPDHGVAVLVKARVGDVTVGVK